MSLLVSYISNYKWSHQDGYSLLELAIVLIVLGIIGGLSLPLLTGQIKRAALAKTKAHQEYGIDAIAAYVETHRRFPCPADPKEKGERFGVSLASCVGQKAIGILPFKTLGMSEIYAHDGFKRLMTYCVDPGLTDQRNGNYLMTVEGGKILVKNESGHAVLLREDKSQGLTSPNFIAFILISHGESGAGAFMGNGSSNRLQGTQLSSYKRENMDDNFIFYEQGSSEDVVRWESRDQFLKHYVKSSQK